MKAPVIEYTSKYDNRELYEQFYSITTGQRLDQYILCFRRYVEEKGLPTKPISVLDVMCGDVRNAKLLRIAADTVGIKLGKVVFQDQAPALPDSTEHYVSCDVFDLSKVKGRFDLVISIFSGVNCACPFRDNGLEVLLGQVRAKARFSVLVLTHPNSWLSFGSSADGEKTPYVLKPYSKLAASLNLPTDKALSVDNEEEVILESEEGGIFLFSHYGNLKFKQGRKVLLNVVVYNNYNHVVCFDDKYLKKFVSSIEHFLLSDPANSFNPKECQIPADVLTDTGDILFQLVTLE